MTDRRGDLIGEGSGANRAPQNPFAGQTVLLVAAHPDDEVLFASSQLAECRKLWIVHVTDGARSKGVARMHGFQTRADYARARRCELRAALDAGNIVAECSCLGARNSYACLNLVSLTRRLAALIANLTPDVILTHPHDGSHLDHDSVAFMVRLATAMRAPATPIWEMACYHWQDGRLASYTFPDTGGQSALVITLTPIQQLIKRKMLGCFSSQKEVIAQLNIDCESFRRACPVDFTYSPRSDRLVSKSDNFGYEGTMWRVLFMTSQQVLQGLLPTWRLFPIKAATGLMIVITTSRWHRLYPRAAKPLKWALFVFSTIFASIPYWRTQRQRYT